MVAKSTVLTNRYGTYELCSAATAYARRLANWNLRQDLLDHAKKDRELQRELRAACRGDLVFFVNLAIWTYSPKDSPDDPVVPMSVWPFQELALQRMARAIGRHDLLVEKSRDMGASWMCLLTFLWRWQFRPHQKFTIVSRTEDLVDRRNDPDCLFWKLDFALRHQPEWLRPRGDPIRNKLILTNPDNGSVIAGASTTGETSRGGRSTAAMFDEFASVEDGYAMDSASRDNTNCRFFNSTPKGMGNAFADIAHREGVNKLTLHWSMHPQKAEKLYCWTDDGLDLFGEEREPLYQYVQDGKLRSPWYDLQEARAASDQSIAQELDIDYHRSGWQFFSGLHMQNLLDGVRTPLYRGELEGAQDKAWFVEVEKGRLRIWVPLGADQVAMGGDFVVGCDVAAGHGGRFSSRSAVSVVNSRTGQKVAEFTARDMEPDDFADYAILLCQFFRTGETPAFLIWEANGPGGQFSKQVQRRRFTFIYRRSQHSKGRHAGFKGTDAAWVSNKDTKRRLLGDYGRALRAGEFKNPSNEAVEELSQYVHMPNGDIIHSRAAASKDPTEHGENHGDLVIADALAWLGACERGRWAVKEADEKVPERSPAGRQMAQPSRTRNPWGAW